MADTRSRREKLMAMAASRANPHEAAVAQRKLAEMDAREAAPRSPYISSSVSASEFQAALERMQAAMDRLAGTTVMKGSFGFHFRSPTSNDAAAGWREAPGWAPYSGFHWAEED